jgi:AcrR family transcriptional regulator
MLIVGSFLIVKLDCLVPYFHRTGLSSTICFVSETTMASGQPGAGQPQAGQTRTARKRRAILDAATKLFLAEGYLATSMDEIAAAASVSKQTVYKQFAGKENLFREIVTATVAQVSDPVAEQIAGLRETTDPAAGLQALARALLAQVLQPKVMRLRRLVIGEAGRFPELGRLFYDTGPGRTIDTLAATFERLAASGTLHLEDPRTAAEHFNWLVISSPLNRVMLCGDAELPAQPDLDRYADAGTRAFLAAYRPN